MTKQNSLAKLAVAGVGLIGKRHAEIIAKRAHLVGIADPAEGTMQVARGLGTLSYPDIAELISANRPDGVVIATPNQCHEADGLACIRAGIPVLIEKPLADSVAAAGRLVEAAEANEVPLLVGHHRRYNPLIKAAKLALDSGHIGKIVGVNAMCWLRKPDHYFEVDWRRRAGSGPVYINLIHDIELLLHLCGPISAVQAMESSAVRGHEIEDTATILLRFQSGTLGTVTVSDAIASPWSWELTAAENPAYAATGGYSYAIGGTAGSLSVPDM